jgi:hypothetical protein
VAADIQIAITELEVAALRSPRKLWDKGLNTMAAWRRAIESLGDEDSAKLRSIAQSRTEPASRVERARILLAYGEDPSFLRSDAGLDCIIRRSSVASSGPWPKADGRLKTTPVLG